MKSKKWNPRFISYARAHGRTPAAQLKHDKAKFPGGCMCGFIEWIAEKKKAFWKAHPEAFIDHYSVYDMKAWTKFLASFEKV